MPDETEPATDASPSLPPRVLSYATAAAAAADDLSWDARRVRDRLVGLACVLYVASAGLIGLLGWFAWDAIVDDEPDWPTACICFAVAGVAISCCLVQTAMVWRRSIGATIATIAIATIFAVGCVGLVARGFAEFWTGPRVGAALCCYSIPLLIAAALGAANAVNARRWYRLLTSGEVARVTAAGCPASRSSG